MKTYITHIFRAQLCFNYTYMYVEGKWRIGKKLYFPKYNRVSVHKHVGIIKSTK